MKERLSRFAPFLFIGVAGAAAIYAVSRNRQQLAAVLDQLDLLSVLASMLFGMLGTFATFLLWRRVLVGLGVDPPRSESFHVYFVSQLGKYLPGAVWPVVAQMEFGKNKGIARRTMLAANALTLALGLAVGLLVAAALLPFASASALRTFSWFFLFFPVLLALLHPRTIPWVLDWVLRRTGRPAVAQQLAWSPLLRAVGWALLSWVLLGLHLYSLTSGLGVTGPRVLAATVGGFALAVSAGILFIPAPAGAGIRDAVLILTLAVCLTRPQALGVGLASRVLLVVVDLIMAGLAVLGARLWRSDRISA